MFNALIFDLDDTLYSERDFVKSGCKAVARHLAAVTGCSVEAIFELMMDTFDRQGRHMVFPEVIEKLGPSTPPLQDLVDIYRQHKPSIELPSGYRELLARLSRTWKLGIITDGLPEIQKRKVEALGLEKIIENIIYTWEYGMERQKPHPHSFTLMLENLGVGPERALFIGDNPDKDLQGAHGIGMKAAHVCTPSWGNSVGIETSRVVPDYCIETLLDLPQILQQAN
jgi:putative hydrolase of the HAD superfamily